jgi:hypothetical protein
LQRTQRPNRKLANIRTSAQWRFGIAKKRGHPDKAFYIRDAGADTWIDIRLVD